MPSATPWTSSGMAALPEGLEVSVALTNCGDMQLELIQQRCDTPSMFQDFLAAGHEGMQHFAVWPDDGYSIVYELFPGAATAECVSRILVGFHSRNETDEEPLRSQDRRACRHSVSACEISAARGS